jgi:hypothetical protein
LVDFDVGNTEVDICTISGHIGTISIGNGGYHLW